MRVWILGAPDPEMQLIEGLLAEAGEQVAHALDATGQRVHPGAAYRATALSAPVPEGAAVYAVECGGPAIPARAVVIDHHRPGDPGYGRPPAAFLPASSIGQVIAVLARAGVLPASWPVVPASDGQTLEPGCIRLHEGRWVVRSVLATYAIPEHFVLAAAADHCLAAAYRGECPGVEPGALMYWRAEVRARHQGRSAEALMEDVLEAQYILEHAETLGAQAEEYVDFALGECDLGHELSRYRCGLCGRTWTGCMPGEHPSPVCELYYAIDMRGQHVPELPEAAVRGGFYYVAEVVERDGRRKVVFGGATTPERVRAFMGWASAQGYNDVYGDPERGFAGAYVADAAAALRAH